MKGKCFCPLGEGAINPVLSSIKHFRDDYEQCIRGRRATGGDAGARQSGAGT
jgi:NADH:ubiquinone oxidoreductase subunit F (NADH-binding)